MADLLIDIHCHGAVGANFGTDTEGSRRAVAHHHEAGVEGVVASLVSGSTEQMVAEARALAPLIADGSVLGLHLEGPFLAEACRGAHDPAALRDFEPELLETMVEALAEEGVESAIRQMTFAPERPGADELLEQLGELGIVPAFGHTAATASELRSAIARAHEVCGRPPLITHLFNGMPPFHHRDPGPVAAALSAAARGEAYIELIADGVHVAPEAVRMVFDTAGPDRVILVSDAMAATGLGDGAYSLGQLEVVVEGGTARLRSEDGSTGSIAGSTSTLADCVRWAIETAGVDEESVKDAASRTPRMALDR
ncbi:MAG: N-acetylglucosamine-6-phosphate deacetylase [Actinomycetia bacterium]|nr:N-acetylglucosamine-6-phosphate deacetylase [Actinomycetes bacterium]